LLEKQADLKGVLAVFTTPLFLGVAPVFGKLAINADADPFTVAALRTVTAVVFLWVIYALFFRKYIFIYPAGLMGCIVIGIINGIGSLFYYSGLDLLDASLVQLINGMYLAFAVLLSRIGGQRADRRTLVRVLLAMIALLMITGLGTQGINWTGVGLMLGSALMFAGTLIFGQYVLFEMPAPTAALYYLTTMAVIVSMVWLAVSEVPSPEVMQSALPPIIALGVTTALSRLVMFAGVKLFGGMQTAIVAIMEIAVALVFSFAILGDRLSNLQWMGVAVLFSGILLIRQRDLLPHGFNPNALIVANMASVQFQRIAFHRAFGTEETDDAAGTMSAVTTKEMQAIQKMMGARIGGVDPFPIRESTQINAMAQVDQQLGDMNLSLPDDIFETQEIEVIDPENADKDD
jgi:drug/metabolite transporter (DMT)-like permease